MANPNNVDLTVDGVFFIATGVCSRICCAPKTWAAEAVEAHVNKIDPTGISSRWAMAEPEPCEGPFNNANHVQCPDESGRWHWLMNC